MNNISEALTKTMKTCISKNILREYLVENQGEVISLVQKLFSQKIALESYIDDLMEVKEQIIADKEAELAEKDDELAEMYDELAEKKILLFNRDNRITKLENDKTRLENDKIETIKNLINNQVGFSLEEIAKITNTSVEEVIKIKNEM